MLNLKRLGTLLAKILLTVMIATPSSSFWASEAFKDIKGIGLHNAYNLGKSLYHRKLACKTCPTDHKNLDANSAKTLIEKLNQKPGFAQGLTGVKRQSVIIYLSERFETG